ncbi:Nucleolar Complex 2 protein [Mycoemilia scoparia]|uniref:Nucleolar Complex 2 protein n=1 Tax=Mycoemilia scoparia TaxID=417184 RepID=A0A9W8A9K0_9FUNG|nr:Nucleolar Complex 2 protein [Mycoemilia scoparia]
MGKVKKSTRKYSQKGLKRELDQRHKIKKAKQDIKKREILKTRKKAHNASVSANYEKNDGSDLIAPSERAVLDEIEKLTKGKSKLDIEDMDMEEEEDSDDSAEAPEDLSDSDMDEENVVENEESESDGVGGGDDDDELDAAELKKQIEELKKSDSKFYEFLQKNDPGALDIDDLDQDDEEEEDEEEEEEEELPSDEDEALKASEKKAKSTATILTKQMIEGWQKELTKSHSLKPLKKLISAFRSASIVHEKADKNNASSFKIESDTIFNKVMIVALKTVPRELQHHLPSKTNIQDPEKAKSSKYSSPDQHPTWSKIRPVVKSYLSSFLHLLNGLPEASMVQYMIKESEKTMPYLACFPKQAREYIRILLEYFGKASVDDSSRILAMLSLRRLVVFAPNLSINMVLKGIYLTYVRNSNIKSIHAISRVQLMRDSGVELYLLNADASYQHAFIYIRQLAIHLRNSMNVRSTESYKAIYNWQFINSLRFWTEVMAIGCGDRAEELSELCEVLEPLVYPLVQIILGVVRLVPTAKYFPLRLHCISMLIRLRSATGVYIPTLPLILEVFESTEFTQRRPQKSTLTPLEFDAIIKAPKQYEHTKVYLEGILEWTYELLADCFAAEATRIAFPEWAIPAIIRIRWWRKHASKNHSKFAKQLQGLLEKIDQTSKWVEKKRATLGFNPTKLEKANTFLQDVDLDTTPIGSHAAMLRKLKAQQRKVLVESSKQEEN